MERRTIRSVPFKSSIQHIANRQNDPSIPEPTAPPLRNCKPGGAVSNGQPPPPLHDWYGTPAPNDEDDGSSEGAAGGSSSQSASTTWMPVETCLPCQAPVSATTSASAIPSAKNQTTTEQVGVTQLSNNVAAVAVPPSSTPTSTSSGAKHTTTQTQADDSLNRRADDEVSSGANDDGGGETVTKNGQCCHTTYTASIVNGPAAGPTGTSSGIGAKSSGKINGTSLSGTLHVGGTAHSIVPTGSTTKPSGTASAGGLTNLTGNGTVNGTGNATGNNSAGSWKLDIVGLVGYGRVALGMGAAVGFAGVVGGWSLV